MATIDELSPVISGFSFAGKCVQIQEIKTGHINRTYRLSFIQGGVQADYILQRISPQAFKHPDQVMENVRRVTEHLRHSIEARGESAENRVLRVIPTRDGKSLLIDAEGGPWRAYNFISGAHSVNAVESAEQFREVGRAFGEFQSMLADFPIEQLHDTIPHFHDTVRRIANFEGSVSKDVAGRAGEVQTEIDFVRRRREAMGRIVAMIGAGTLPLRVTHNDTKCNNVMVDDHTGRALCVVDLDTVMAGSSLYDFGDAIRFGASTAAEDEADLTRVRLDMELFTAFADGFISQTAGGLTDAELQSLTLGALVMTFEVGLRFLTDYLDGDTYFRIDYPEHNLVRARCQFRLLEDMEAHRDDMEAAVAGLVRKYRAAP